MDFSTILREQQAGLRAFIRALGADEAWVDDLAQEVFLIAYRKRSDFKEDADIGKWLRGIARFLVRGELAKQARRSRLMHNGVTDILMNLGQEESAADSHASALLTALKSCVSELPDPVRSLLQDRYQEGRRAKELARGMNSTAVAVRKKLQRIRLLVRQCIESKLREVAP